MPLEGAATTDGTALYARTHANAAPGHFRTAGAWTVSSIGMGTYLGAPDDATDQGYAASLARAVDLGCNAVDTAVNYRDQRSERVVGRTLRHLVDRGATTRDQVVVSTKGGFLPHDHAHSGDRREYVEQTLIRSGVITADDIVAGCHCMTPAYLRHQLEISRRNLDLATIDIYHLHNPETQLQEVTRAEFLSRVRAAFAALEQAAADGHITVYGTATWNGHRVAPTAPDHLDLEELIACATEVAGPGHHFRALQLPVSLGMPEAATAPTQHTAHGQAPLLDVAREHGMLAQASASLLQGRVVGALAPDLRRIFGTAPRTDAQRALQFVRSAPGVSIALAGMSTPTHVDDNLATARIPPMSAAEFASIFA